MNANDKKRFASALYALGDYYGRTISDGVVGLYWQGLCSFSIEDVELAISRHIRNTDTGQFMPKISDIVKMMEGSTQDSSVIAWAKVMRAVSSAGMYQSVAFDDALIHAAIENIGGWPKLCQCTEAELPFVQKRFEQNYRAYKVRNETPPYPTHLVGIAEGQNAQKGYAIEPPRIIGDRFLATLVMQGGTEGARIPVSIGSSLHRVVDAITDQANRGAA